jgi:aspartate/methionine/tyrosine aminotransferase
MRLSERVRGLKPSAIRQLFDAAPPDAINLGLGELQFPEHPVLQEIIRQEALGGNFRYTPNAGLPRLREAAAVWSGTEPDRVCVTNGAEEAAFCALAALIDPGDEVLVADPGYLAYAEIVRLLGGVPVAFPLDPANGFRVDREAFRQAVTSRTGVIAISHPSNPLGVHWPAEDIDWLCEAFPSLPKVVDEVYAGLFADEPIPGFPGHDGLIRISGVSKVFGMTGWRIGWTIAEPDATIAITRAHQYVSTCAGALAQRVAARALTEGAEINADLRRKLSVNRELARAFFPVHLPNTAGPFLFVRVGGDDADWCRRALERGVIVTPGSAFGSNGAGWVRVNYGLERDRLGDALRRLEGI